MSLLRVAVFGPPEVVHDGSRLTFALRKAQALLLYLAVEGGLHPRSKLAAFLWPDSEPHDARTALRNALALLRSLLADPNASASQHSLIPSTPEMAPGQGAHLLSQHDALGLNPHAALELDLEMVQQAYQQAQRHATIPPEEQRVALITQVQRALALVRGPFLDGFELGEDAPFNEWRTQQQLQWQVRLLLLFERLSSWQETGGELEQATATLTHWLTLDPLSEEASRRLMRLHLALGDPTAAGQVYATLRTRLAEDLRVKPSPDTVALAEHIRALAARRQCSAVRATTVEGRPPGELVAPLLGRAAAFRLLVERFQQAQAGQPQTVLVVGEAGIGKTRLADEFVAWARAQGAEVLSGQAFEAGGRLPYQPLVEALRGRLEEENAPEDLLEDLWLAELARLLPELRVRYPDLSAPSQDELTAKGRLFEAVARLLDALAKRGPLVLLVDDLQWADEVSLDLLRYLGRDWKGHGNRVLLLGTVRSEGLEPKSQLSAQLTDLGRDLPISQVPLQALSQAETLQLIEALVGQGRHTPAWPARAVPVASSAPEQETKLSALGDFLFAHTGGQPLYLLETLKLLRERKWLVPRLGEDGNWRLEPTAEMAAALAQASSRHELLPPSVRTMILLRLAKLSRPARQLVMASAVLGTSASAQLLWQVAEVGMQEGVEALEEAVKSGLLREEEAGAGHMGRYRFTHELMRDVVSTTLGQAQRLVLHQRALARLQAEGVRASEYHTLLAGEAAYYSSVQAGDKAMAVFAGEDAIEHYE